MFYFLGAKNTHNMTEVTNMQACAAHSLHSQTQRTGSPRLTVTSALSGLTFELCFCFAFYLSSTFGNTHTGELSPNVALVSLENSGSVSIAPRPSHRET